MNEDIRAILVHLKGTPDKAEIDAEIADALRHTSWFTHVFLMVSAWQVSPDPFDDPIFKLAVSNIRMARKKLILGRTLYVSHTSGFEIEPKLTDIYDLSYYAAAIARIRGEAAAIGADGTFFDCEAYNNASVHRQAFNAGARLYGLRSAISMATRVSGQVDYVFPTSSAREDGYQWIFQCIGKYNCDETTYRLRSGSDMPVRPAPPGYEPLHLWGSFVSPKPLPINRLSIAEAKALDLETVRKNYPDCIGHWVHVNHDETAELLKSEEWERGTSC